MGISANTIRLLCMMLRDKDTGGRVVTYGSQGIEADYASLEKYFRTAMHPYTEIQPEDRRTDPTTQYGDTAHQEVFFRMLGFDRVDSIDLFDNENPTIVHDLNSPVPEDLAGSFDLVVDGGTMEHCFDVKTVLANTVRLLKDGGRVLHINPVSGWINHGFYQFSPTLYYDFYTANGFESPEMVIQFGDRYIEYAGGPLPGDFMGKAGLIMFIAKKPVGLTEITNPTQNMYIDKFVKPPPKAASGMKKTLRDTLPESVQSFLVRLRNRYRLFSASKRIS
jgi:SAM-dependent methyltransferase